MTFDTKFAILGQAEAVLRTAKHPLIVDAANDQGLILSANEFTGSSAPPVVNNQDRETLSVHSRYKIAALN
jgi:hypothetical protein